MYRKKNDLITYEEVIKYLRYDPETGKLFWLTRDVSDFSNQHYCDIWNTKNANKEAGSYYKANNNTYINVRIHRENYKAHRLIWLINYGKLPDGIIDHIDHNGLNNKLDNLRDIPKKENAKNFPKKKTNTSGHTNIQQNKSKNRWRVTIQNDRKNMHFGSFKTLKEALIKRDETRKIFNFHEKHGE